MAAPEERALQPHDRFAHNPYANGTAEVIRVLAAAVWIRHHPCDARKPYRCELTRAAQRMGAVMYPDNDAAVLSEGTLPPLVDPVSIFVSQVPCDTRPRQLRNHVGKQQPMSPAVLRWVIGHLGIDVRARKSRNGLYFVDVAAADADRLVASSGLLMCFPTFLWVPPAGVDRASVAKVLKMDHPDVIRNGLLSFEIAKTQPRPSPPNATCSLDASNH